MVLQEKTDKGYKNGITKKHKKMQLVYTLRNVAQGSAMNEFMSCVTKTTSKMTE